MQKISIKREQSQAGLSFAEREKFRPQVKNKLLLLLALLMTAVTGAWADSFSADAYAANATLNGVSVTANQTVTINEGVTVTVNNGLSIQSNATLTVTGGGTLVVNGTTGADGQDDWDEGHPTAGGPGGAAITINSGAQLALSNATVIANGGQGGKGGTGVNGPDMVWAASGANGNGFASFPTIDGAVLSYSTNGTDYTEYAPGNSTLYRYMKAVATAPASSGYTVSLKDGVKDADKWTVKVGEGQAQALPIGGLKGDGSETVTLQYNGRLKVKGVTATSDAAPAKEPATVTTAPTGAAVVGVGKTTALVSGGVADGGTLMYAVTTTNTKPASTDGFSDAVPTAQTITASGTVYVWYYVKADDTHTDSEIAATAIEVPVADIVWDATNVSDLYVSGTYASYTMDGIKLSGNADEMRAMWYDYGDPEMDGLSFEAMESGGYTFTAPTGKAFTKIVMKLQGPAEWDHANLGDGWAFVVNDMGNDMILTVTWKGGSAASTVDLLKDAGNFMGGEKVKYIAFYLSE